MKIDFEHSSRRTLLWYAAAVNVIGWIIIVAVVFAAYVGIKHFAPASECTQKSEVRHG